MKHISSIASIILVVSAFFVCSCNLMEQPAAVDGGAVNFKASAGVFTKVSDGVFSAGDVIAISAGAPINASNVPYTFEGGVLSSSKEIRWVDGQNTATLFSAYYPYLKSAEKDGIIDISVARDQNVANTDHFDFMTARTEASPGDGAVNLNFRHRMSLVEVVVNSKLPVSDLFVKAVRMEGLKVDAYYSIDKDQVTVTGDSDNIAFYCDNGELEAGVAARFHAFIPAQTARPVLGVIVEGGKSYYFHLPSDFKFEEGKRYTAEVTIEPGRVDADFAFSLYPWEMGKELVFPGNDNWKYIGTGKYIDGVLAEAYGVENYEMNVEVYEDPSCPGRYKFANPYAEWPYWSDVNHDADGEIIIRVLPDGTGAYIEESHIGVSDFSIMSLVPENGFNGYSYYLFSDYPGVWSSTGILGLSTGNAIYGYDSYAKTTFTLPGNIRYPVNYYFEELSINEDGTVITYKPGMDLTEVHLALIPTPFKITDGVFNAVAYGTSEYIVQSNCSNYGNRTYQFGPEFSSSCAYYAIVGGLCKYEDGNVYASYQYIRTIYRAAGQEDPECSIEISDFMLSDNDPTAFEFNLKVRDANRIRYIALTASEFGAMPENTDWKSYILANGTAIPGNVNNLDFDGQKAIVSGLQYDTDYHILVYAENLFGKSDVKFCSGRTGSAMEFKSIGVGKFYDQLFPMYLSRSYSEMPDYLYNEVEILQEASGKPIYRVMNPYGKFWNLYANSEPWYNGNQCDYIEFSVKEFPEGNFVFFKDFATGCDFYEDFDGDGTPEPYGLYCNNYVRGNADNPAAGEGTFRNRQLSEGVFQIAPALMIGNSNYYYAYYQSDEAIIICLPGYDYTFSFEQPQSKSFGQVSTRIKALEKVKAQ